MPPPTPADTIHTQTAHLDLKPQNLFIAEGLRAKVGDFGLAELAGTIGTVELEQLAGWTYEYAAPEQLAKLLPKTLLDAPIVPHGKPADVYAFAMTLFRLYAGGLPWGAAKWHDKFHVAAVVNHAERPAIPDTVPKEIETLIRDCWNGNPTKRPAFNDIAVRLDDFADVKGW